MASDIEIAQAAKLRPIVDVARELDLSDDELELYGKYKAKVDFTASWHFTFLTRTQKSSLRTRALVPLSPVSACRDVFGQEVSPCGSKTFLPIQTFHAPRSLVGPVYTVRSVFLS